MKKFELQYAVKGFNMPLSEHRSEIKETLKKFQDGYTKRNLKNADAFVDELFLAGEDTLVLGTGTGELFLGSRQVKTLIRDDWQYWGDINIDWENAHIDSKGDAAWFATAGTLKYSFKDTPERYDSYVNFIKSKAVDIWLSTKQKLTFINWVLSLAFHQRGDSIREYLWPLSLTGVLLKENNSWKIARLHFSIPGADFPDERFENSPEYLEDYKKQNEKALNFRNNRITPELKNLLKNMGKKLFGQKSISAEAVQGFFSSEGRSYVIGPDNMSYYDIDQVTDYFNENSDLALTLEMETAIASKFGDINCLTVTGLLKQNLTEEELNNRTLEKLNNLFDSDLTSEEKIFEAHINIAYAIKESASGEHYTCPVRLTAVTADESGVPVFKFIHFSFPCCWILEGKINSVQTGKI